jgi:hypothetical protein
VALAVTAFAVDQVLKLGADAAGVRLVLACLVA